MCIGVAYQLQDDYDFSHCKFNYNVHAQLSELFVKRNDTIWGVVGDGLCMHKV